MREIMNRIICDSPAAWQWGFQDPASPIMQGLIHLHHSIFWLIVVILTFVLYILVYTVMKFVPSSKRPSDITHGTVLEIVWTSIPAIILAIIALPSFVLLYSMDEIINPSLTVKTIGSQWFWSYEFSDGENNINFDSYMIPEDDLKLGQFRLLEVDNPLVLPILTHIRILVTATDVLHSWAIPSLGVKIDAVPGRLNQVSIFLNRPGIFRGQCSEICGINHGFMPIVIHGVSLSDFLLWISSFK